jgi:hypothetical protein
MKNSGSGRLLSFDVLDSYMSFLAIEMAAADIGILVSFFEKSEYFHFGISRPFLPHLLNTLSLKSYRLSCTTRVSEFK